jgi:hypothetical protein
MQARYHSVLELRQGRPPACGTNAVHTYSWAVAAYRLEFKRYETISSNGMTASDAMLAVTPGLENVNGEPGKGLPEEKKRE